MEAEGPPAGPVSLFCLQILTFVCLFMPVLLALSFDSLFTSSLSLSLTCFFAYLSLSNALISLSVFIWLSMHISLKASSLQLVSR